MESVFCGRLPRVYSFSTETGRSLMPGKAAKVVITERQQDVL
ncbi:MAG: hypothetical protein ACI8P0_004177, partial [Planctomycetaceae bacterium]